MNESVAKNFSTFLRLIKEYPNYLERISDPDKSFIMAAWDLFAAFYNELPREVKEDIIDIESLNELVNCSKISDEELFNILVMSSPKEHPDVQQEIELLPIKISRGNTANEQVEEITHRPFHMEPVYRNLKIREQNDLFQNPEKTDVLALGVSESESKTGNEDESCNDSETDWGDSDVTTDCTESSVGGVSCAKESSSNESENFFVNFSHKTSLSGSEEKSPVPAKFLKNPDFESDHADTGEKLGEIDTDDSNSSGIDYFKDLGENDSETENVMFGELYNEDVKEIHNTSRKTTKRKKSSSDTADSDSGNEVYDSKNYTKSGFELKQEKINKKIQDLEQTALERKPWTLKGEVVASERPVNSLLEEVVEMDMSQRPAPVVTEEVTQRLEDVICSRINNRTYDNVLKKFKPLDTPQDFKKNITFDQEKSKLSLAKIYEKQYLKQRDERREEEHSDSASSPEKQEIQDMMYSLFRKLDVLSNHHFVPKPVQPELKIISQLPAAASEEVGPVSSSVSNLLAPQEIAGTSKEPYISKDERTRTDKKRERRRRKKIFAIKAQKSSKTHEPFEKIKHDRKMKKFDGRKPCTSSKDLFSTLQEYAEPSPNHLQTALKKTSPLVAPSTSGTQVKLKKKRKN